MPNLDPLAEALARLCEREGGYVAVADRIEMNDQSVYQVITGVKDSKSGNPKSVGSRMRRALDKHFPDWLAVQPHSLWPFSPELLDRVSKASDAERRRAENAARLVLDMDQLPREANDLEKAA